MCSHFSISWSFQLLAQKFAWKLFKNSNHDFEIYPKKTAPAILLQSERTPHLVPAFFGFQAPKFWIVNARIETLTQKKLFIPYLNQRALIPMEAFYEWDPTHHKKYCFSSTISKNRKTPLLFATALWKKIEEQFFFVLLTGPPQHPEVACVHHRSPLFLPQSVWNFWLDSNFLFPKPMPHWVLSFQKHFSFEKTLQKR